jgi:hypothetical protein
MVDMTKLIAMPPLLRFLSLHSSDVVAAVEEGAGAVAVKTTMVAQNTTRMAVMVFITKRARRLKTTIACLSMIAIFPSSTALSRCYFDKKTA